MSLDLKIRIDMSESISTTDKQRDSLEDLADHCEKTGIAGKAAGQQIAAGMGEAGAATKKAGDDFSGLTEAQKRQESMLQRIKGPWDAYRADLQAAVSLVQQGRLSTGEYEAELGRLEGRLGSLQRYSMSPELQRQADILEQINGPLRQYEQTLAALDQLLAKERIDLAAYNRELERAQAAYSHSLGPVQGPVQQKPSAGAGAGDAQGALSQVGGALLGQAGPAGSIAQSALGGGALMFAGITVGAVALGRELISLSDEWAQLQNRVMRFTEDGHTANEILASQAVLSRDLHASLEGTIGLYAKFREATYELNLGQARQAVLTKEIGEAVVGSGGSVEQATGLVQRLSLAFSSGAVQSRELRAVMKEFPEIATGFAEATGKSRQELLALASKGELSAQQLLDAFDKMAPQMEERVKRLNHTWSEAFGHLADDAKIAFSNAFDTANTIITGPIGAQVAAFEKSQRLLQRQAEIERQIRQERERVAHLAPVAAAGNALGINIGAFSADQVNALDAVRIRMRDVGVPIADSFSDARNKATLYSTKLDELRDAHAAQIIADDAKRIYQALDGVDNKIEELTRGWQKLNDAVKLTSGVADKLKTAAPAGVPPAVLDQMRREADLEAANAKTAVADAQYGQKLTDYAQGINKARAELVDLNRAHAAGIKTGEAFRTEYDHLLTTINDGRLPSTIKLWEELHLPMQQFALDTAAADLLLKNGTYTLQQYRIEMQKLADTAGEGASWKQRQATQDILDGRQASSGKYLHGFNPAQEARVDSLDKLTTGPAQEYAARLRDIDVAMVKLNLDTATVAALQDQAREQFGSSAAALTRVTVSVVGYREQLAQLAARQDLSDEQRVASIAQLDRERAIVAQFAQPAEIYKRALEDIAGAQRDLSLTEAQASVLRRKAKDEYNAATEALQKQRGPLQEYEAALRKINEQQSAGNISARRANDELAKARISYLQASDEGKTFAGAFEQQMLQLKESTKDVGASIAKLATDDIGKLSDSLIDAANGGKFSFSDMAESMLIDLEKVLAKALIVQGVTSLLGSGGGGGDSAISLASLVPAAMNIAGYATGGSWTVGGSGSGDTQLQMFRATPGEQVTVTPVGAYPHAAPTAYGGSQAAARVPAPVVNIHNHYDKDAVLAAVDSPQGSKTIVNQLRANSGAVRSFLGIRR